MATLQTYDLKGLKLSFANWISNLSPTDTPFVSMTGKETVDEVKFSWQVDRLAKPVVNAVKEGSEADDPSNTSTDELENYTQILRKVVKVTDTAKKVGLYGRQSELSYQMEKAGLEIKRDLEYTFLNQGGGTISTSTGVRKTSGFAALVATLSKADTDTGAVVHKETASATKFTEKEIFDLTYNLYLAGANANHIMFHPKHHILFSKILNGQESTSTHRFRMFDGLDEKFNLSVQKIKDPLGQEFTLVCNRFMPEDAIYFFNPSDWTQMLFSSPERVQLAKNGSNEKWMIVMETGLRHRNPYASGVLRLKSATVIPTDIAGVNALSGAALKAVAAKLQVNADGTDAEIRTAIIAKLGLVAAPAVTDFALAGAGLTGTNVAITGTGTVTLTVTPTPSNGDVTSLTAVSSAPAKATATITAGKVVITGVAAGTANVTVTIGSVKKVLAVTVS